MLKLLSGFIEAARVLGPELRAASAGEDVADLYLADPLVPEDLAPGFAPGEQDAAVRPEGLAGIGEDVEAHVSLGSGYVEAARILGYVATEDSVVGVADFDRACELTAF